MIEKIGSIIFPNEVGLQIIIGIILALAIVVLILGLKINSRTRKIIKLLDATKDVDKLSRTLLIKDVDYELAFADFKEKILADGKIKQDDNIFEHIRTIYMAGTECSRLDGKLLVENTINSIFRNVDILKSIISMFLVLGILGTLIGLGYSILQFSNLTVSSGNTAELNEVLQNLFGRLKGAFAPSIWGISMTIASVLGYSWFIHGKCINNLTEKLTDNTIKYWMPKLYPTEFQRGENTIAQFNETVKNAHGINKNVEELQNNLEESNETVVAFNKMTNGIVSSTNTFKTSIDKLGDLKSVFVKFDESHSCYLENMKGISGEFKGNIKLLERDFRGVGQAIKVQQETFKTLSDHMDDTSRKMLVSISKSREELDAASTNSARMADRMYDIAKRIEAREEHIIKAVVDPITKTINEQIKTIAKIETSLNNLKNPLASTEDKISEWLKINYNHNESVKGTLEASAKNLNLAGEKIEGIAKSYVAQINNLTQVLREQDTHMEQLEESIQILGEGLVKTGNLSDADLSKMTRRAVKQQKTGFMTMIKNNAGFILVGALLLASVVIQGIMVAKIGNLEATQVQIIKTINDVNK